VLRYAYVSFITALISSPPPLMATASKDAGRGSRSGLGDAGRQRFCFGARKQGRLYRLVRSTGSFAHCCRVSDADTGTANASSCIRGSYMVSGCSCGTICNVQPTGMVTISSRTKFTVPLVLAVHLAQHSLFSRSIPFLKFLKYCHPQSYPDSPDSKQLRDAASH
jgi:hypothetical protein